MFAGTKGVPQFKQGNSGTSLNIPFGTAVNRVSNTNTELSLNNLVLGSGMTIGGLSSVQSSGANSGNILLGVTDVISNQTSSNLTVSGSSNIIFNPTNSSSFANYTMTGVGNVSLNGIVTATASGNYNVAIGYQASANNTTTSNNIAIGQSAIANAGTSIAIGATASVTIASGVAIGQSATNANNAGVAIGSAAIANGNGVAVGASANCGSGSSVAIGPNVTTATSANPHVLIGQGINLNSTSRNSCIIISPSSATAGGDYQVMLGANIGQGGTALGQTRLGYGSQPSSIAEIGFGGQSFASSTDTQVHIWVGRKQTTDATPAEVGNNSTSMLSTTIDSYYVMTSNSTYLFNCDIVARKSATGTDYSAWNVQFCINRESTTASTALVGTPTYTIIGQTAGASGWTIAVTADTTNGRPVITVTGQAATTIRWVAKCNITKVSN